MTLREFVINNGIKNVFQYAAIEENLFERQAEEFGYTRQTTFYSDLSIGEWCGGKRWIKETFDNVCKHWKNNKVYFPEFVMALNWKSWEWHSRNNDELSSLYVDLYEKAYDIGIKTFKGDDLSYFYNTLD